MLNHLISHSILNSADRNPEHLAFTDGRRSLTYADLVANTEQLANTLLQVGVRKGDRVGIYLNRCLDTAIAIYGIMRIGALYVPLDIKAPIEMTSFSIQDADIQVLISNQSQRHNLSLLVARNNQISSIVGVNGIERIENITWDDVATQDQICQVPFRILEKDPAYIIYTSGSTGRPKGIVHTHESGLSYAKLTTELYQITEEDHLANHAPIFFDISTLAYFSAPYVGASSLILSDAHTMMPASLCQMIEQEKISIWYSVPLALIQMIKTGLLSSLDLSSLRWIFFAGEPFAPKYLRALMELIPHAQYSNIYGPAETNQCTNYNLSKIPSTNDPIPIGRVWANTDYLVVNDQDEMVEKGEVGELLIRSQTMMQGYWNRPERTEKSFFRFQNPAGHLEVYYRTGDLVREDDEELLHFIGRKDHQVKVRGYRVELGAIEMALLELNGITHAAVFTDQPHEEAKEIYAAVILDDGTEINVQTIIDHLKSQFQAYALPKDIFVVRSFPRTGSDKVDRNELKVQLLNSTV